MKNAPQHKNDTKPHLDWQAKNSLITRAMKYATDIEWDFDKADRWERHAVNAVRDLQAAESELASLRTRNSELEEGIKRYGKHAYLCQWHVEAPCSCGFSALLAPDPAKDAKETERANSD